MNEFEDLIINNAQFQNIVKSHQNISVLMFETEDELFLNNFSLCYAKFLLCTGDIKPCRKCQNCQRSSHADVKIYPKNGKNILVDDVKDLTENIYLKPLEADKKIFIFNSFSTANVQSQNKLLKILEETPKNSFIILNVTNPSKILPTIMSRCNKFHLNPFSKPELMRHFAGYDADKLENAIEVSGGSLTKTVLYLRDKNLVEIFANCLNTILELKDSRMLLKYSTKFKSQKENFTLILEIFESLYRDILLIKLNKKDYITNKREQAEIESIIGEYDCDAVDKIIRKIIDTKKKLESNCNTEMLIESLFLYILEVKYLCKK